MSDTEPPGEKPHDPTPRKLEKARQKGEIAKSNDLVTAASYGGLCLAALAFGGSALAEAGAILRGFLDAPDQLAAQIGDGRARLPAGGAVALAMANLAPLFGIPAVAACLSLVAQNAFVFASDRLKPKLSRISPLSNARNKYGRGGLFEFFKSFLKLVVFSAGLIAFLSWNLPGMIGSLELDPGPIILWLMRLCAEFLAFVFLVSLCIGGLDFLWQRSEHMRKNRMSDKEIRDEIKDAEGDPYVKQQRRARGEEIARRQMIVEVREADVLIVNPTHVAIALRWDRGPGSAPECVAKGVDELALRMREVAQEAGVPIYRDPPTARRLLDSVAVGDQIRPAEYRAVATAIRFADAMRQKARGRI